MSRQKTRSANLRRLHEEVGAWAPLAKVAGTSAKYLSLVANESPQDGKPRTLGNEYVERLEAGYDKYPGWFDIDQDNPPKSLGDLPPSVHEIVQLWMESDAKSRELILAVAKLGK